MLLTRKQLRDYLNEMLSKTEMDILRSQIKDPDMRNAYSIYKQMEYQQKEPSIYKDLEAGLGGRTKKTRGSIHSNVFNNVMLLHEKSHVFFTPQTGGILPCYRNITNNTLKPKNNATINQLDIKIRDILQRPATGKYKSNVFGKTQAQQKNESHEHYKYRTGNIGDSVIIQAYNDLMLSDPVQAYYYVMDNCNLPTGDDVELGIAHYFYLLTGLSTQHIDRTGTDISLGDYKIECKSSSKPNTIESGLHASFPEDDRNKFYVFISNRGSDTETQINIINSKLLRFILLFPEIEKQRTSNNENEISLVNDYIQKFGNKSEGKNPNFDWIRTTVKNESENIINNFINKTTLQFQNGNSEDFDDSVTFQVGNAKVMIRTQVSWGLSQLLTTDNITDNENDQELSESSNKIYQKILLELLKNSK